MIRRGETIRVGPIRITVVNVANDKAEVHVATEETYLGGTAGVDTAALERLKEATSREDALLEEGQYEGDGQPQGT